MDMEDLKALYGDPQLRECGMGVPLILLGSVGSTNTCARELALAGAPEGTAVVADSQSAGRGRMDRKWVSPAGVNLYMSVVLRPPRHAEHLTLVAPLAVIGALERQCGLAARVKWPNDVLVNGRKIAGLLGEASVASSGAGVEFVILGVGINLNARRDQLPQRTLYPATSALLESGREVSRAAVARDFFVDLARLYRELLREGFNARLRSCWEERCAVLGHQVTVDTGAEKILGTVLGLDPDGRLRLRLADGRTERVVSGDILAYDTTNP